MSDHAFCNLCKPPRKVETEAMMDHFRVVHDFVPEFETWPDGELVIVDESLEPDDFEDA